MKFKIIWDEGYAFGGARNGPNDPRPTIIEADRSEVMYAPNDAYQVGLRFIKDDVAVAILFQFPLAVITVADVQE